MGKCVLIGHNLPKIMSMHEMPTGRYGVLVGGHYSGCVIISPYEKGMNFVLIRKDGSVDGFSPHCDLKVRLLEPGEMFEITV